MKKTGGTWGEMERMGGNGGEWGGGNGGQSTRYVGCGGLW